MFAFERGNVRNVGIDVLGGVTVSLNIVYFIVITIRNKYLCSKLLEVFKTKARYNWGMRSSSAFEKALKHYDFH